VAYLAYVRSAGWVETGLGETDETLRSTLGSAGPNNRRYSRRKLGAQGG